MNKKSIKKIVVIFVICLTLCVSLFVVQYKQMPNKAKGKLGVYLSRYLPDYVSMNNVLYTVEQNNKGFVIVIGGSVKNSGGRSSKLYSEIQFDYLLSNPYIKKVKIDNKKFNETLLDERPSDYWWR